jgi:hypothetical protein
VVFVVVEFCVCCAGKLKKHGIGIQERFFLCLEIFLLYGFFVQQFGLVANEVVLIEREIERWLRICKKVFSGFGMCARFCLGVRIC